MTSAKYYELAYSVLSKIPPLIGGLFFVLGVCAGTVLGLIFFKEVSR